MVTLCYEVTDLTMSNGEHTALKALSLSSEYLLDIYKHVAKKQLFSSNSSDRRNIPLDLPGYKLLYLLIRPAYYSSHQLGFWIPKFYLHTIFQMTCFTSIRIIFFLVPSFHIVWSGAIASLVTFFHSFHSFSVQSHPWSLLSFRGIPNMAPTWHFLLPYHLPTFTKMGYYCPLIISFSQHLMGCQKARLCFPEACYRVGRQAYVIKS